MQQPRLTAFVDCQPNPVLCLDEAGVITHVNGEATALLLGLYPQLVGMKFFEAFCPRVQDAASKDFLEVEFEVKQAEESRFLKFRIKRCAEESCAPIGYIVAVRDLTDLRRLHEERNLLMEMATISEVLPAILHEFKNPLASIQALVELMTEDCADKAMQEQLHSILMEIRRMKLSFEGLGSTTRNLSSNRNQALDFGIREACTIFERQLKARGIHFTTRIETLPLLPLDSGVIRGVLFNLLNNAKQACQAGDAIEVHAGLKDEGKTFFFSVRDTGPGMSPKILKQCTSLFFTTKRMGSGIGLALCKTAVEKINGRLDIESTEGKGSLFAVSLPLNTSPKKSRSSQ